MDRRKYHIIRIAVLCLSLLALPSCQLEWTTAGNSENRPDELHGYVLNLINPTAVQAIGDQVPMPQALKFVQVEVTEVFNPSRIPLTFRVYYQAAHGEESMLGTFSLFPPDNPGTFIVATRGMLQSRGKVLVKLVPLEEIAIQDGVRVKIRRISFIGK